MADHSAERVVELMQDTGFAQANEVAHRVTRLGRITHCLTTPPEQRASAADVGIAGSARNVDRFHRLLARFTDAN